MKKLLLPILLLVFLIPIYAEPVLIIDYPPQVYVGQWFEIEIDVTDSEGGIQNIQIFVDGFHETTYPCDENSCEFDWMTSNSEWEASEDKTVGFFEFEIDVDNDGEAEETFIIEVVENLPPVLNPIGDKTVDEGELLEFIISASDPYDTLIYSASNLPDGATFNPDTQTFSWTPDYDQSGVYTNIYFEVSDGVSTDSEDITITVNNIGYIPIAVIGAIPTSGPVPLTVDFTGIDSYDSDAGTIVEYYFDFGDGSNSDWITSPTVSHTYTDMGTYTASLIVEDNNEYQSTNTAEIEIYVHSATNTPPTITILEPDGVDDTADNSYTIEWVDSDPDDNAQISLFYSEDDFATGTLIVAGLSEDSITDRHPWDTSALPDGQYLIYAKIYDGVNPVVYDYSSDPVIVFHDLFPTAEISDATPTAGFAPLTVSFYGTGISGNAPLSYSWTFGDGGNSNSQNPIHTYTSTGTYIAELTVTDDDGDTATDTVKITVKVAPQPKPKKNGNYVSSSRGGKSTYSGSVPVIDLPKEKSSSEIKRLAGTLELSESHIETQVGQVERLEITVKNTGTKLATYTLSITELKAEFEPASITLNPGQELTIYTYITADEAGREIATVTLNSGSKILSAQALIVDTQGIPYSALLFGAVLVMVALVAGLIIIKGG